MGIAGEQFGARHDPAIDAIGALIHLLLDPGGLERMRLLRRAETGKRGDLSLGDGGHRRNARAYRLSVDMHGAGAALAEAATEARIVEAKLVAQRVEQRHFGIIDGDHVHLAVDVESELLRHRRSSRAKWIARRPTIAQVSYVEWRSSNARSQPKVPRCRPVWRSCRGRRQAWRC